MTSTLLHILSTKALPLTVTNGSAVDAVHILLLGGHIEAVMEKPVRTVDGWSSPSATVTRITSTGRRMLKLFPASRL